MDYKKCWQTLMAESGGRWCQPHPCSMELLTIGELMRNIEKRSEIIEKIDAVRDNQYYHGIKKRKVNL